MYIKKVIIENFQSHEYTELDLSPGLTIIVGESDRGKSAIIRALRWVFENEPSGTDFIRAGTRNCRVTVETNRGITVIRERTPSRNRYIVRASDGTEETFEGFRNEIPEEVIAAHGVTKIRLDSDLEVSLNIAPQLEGPFLLSSPGSVKAKAIGRLYKVHIIDAAIRDTFQDINKLTREEARIDSHLEELDKKLLEFENLPEIEKRLTKANLLIDKANQLMDQKNKLIQIQKKLHSINGEITYYKGVKTKLNTLNKGIKLYETVGDLENKKLKLADINTRIKYTKEKLLSVKTILGITACIENGYSQYEYLTNMLNETLNLNNFRNKLNEINRNRKIQLEIIQATESIPASIKYLQLLLDINNIYGQLYYIKHKLDTIQNRQKDYRLINIETNKIELASVQYEILSRLERKYIGLVNINNKLFSLKKTMNWEKYLLTKTDQLPIGHEKYNTLFELLTKIGELCNINIHHKTLSERINKGHEYLREREKEIILAIGNYGTMLKKLGKCPTCLNEIDKNTIERIVSEFK